MVVEKYDPITERFFDNRYRIRNILRKQRNGPKPVSKTVWFWILSFSHWIFEYLLRPWFFYSSFIVGAIVVGLNIRNSAGTIGLAFFKSPLGFPTGILFYATKYHTSFSAANFPSDIQDMQLTIGLYYWMPVIPLFNKKFRYTQGRYKWL